jgi:multiple sugar transport system substrate-binding protein
MTRHPSRALRLAAALLLPVATLAACTGSSGSGEAKSDAGSGTGAITIWAQQSQDSEEKALNDAVSSFNSSQSAVKATLKLIPAKDYTKTLTATPASELPDVLEFDGPTLANFVYNGKVAPITSYVSASTVDNVTDAIKAQGTVGGKLYGLGMYDSGLGLYGNKKLLDAAGVKYPTGLADAWTADRFSQALKTLAAKSPSGKALDIQEGNGLATEWGTYGFSPILWSAGGQLIKNGKATGVLDTPAVASAFRTFQSWKAYVDPNTDNNAFTANRVALSWVGHWMYPSYSKALGADLVALPLPDFGNGPKAGQGSWGWGIGASSKNGKAAGAFLDYLLNDKNITAMTEANGAPPATKSVLATSPLYKTGGPLHLFAEQLSRPCGDQTITKSCVAVTRPVTAGYPAVTTNFSQALSSIYSGADPAAALAKAAHAIDQDFADNNGYKLP